MNRRLTPKQVWAFMASGCNADEIADWAGVKRATAVAMMANAARKFADIRKAA